MKSRQKLLTVALAAALGTGIAQAADECAARNFNGYENSVISTYIAYYGRVPDAAGLAYWANELKNRNGDLSSMIDAFGNSEEFTEQFAGLSNEDLINNLYMQAFGRAADQAGLNYYLGELEAGRMTLQKAALDIVNGATGSDARVLENRAKAARHYVDGVEATGKEIAIGDMKSVMADIGMPTNEAEKACGEYDILVAEAAQDTTGLSCDNGGKGEPSKKVGQLTNVAGLSYYSQSTASLGGIKKVVQGETSATGEFEYFEACGESATITFCTGIKKNCNPSESATGIDPALPFGKRILGQIDAVNFPEGSQGITLRDVIESAFSDVNTANQSAILTNVYQLLIGLDDDANETNGVVLSDTTREELDLVADNIDFTFSLFDNDPNVLQLVQSRGRTLPSDERAQLFDQVTEYRNATTTAFNSSDFDDFLVLSPLAQENDGSQFVGINLQSFLGPKMVLESDTVENSSYSVKRLLSNYYDDSGLVSSVRTDLVTATFQLGQSSQFPLSDSSTSPITNEEGSPSSLTDNTTFDAIWEYAKDGTAGDHWELDLFAFDKGSIVDFPSPISTDAHLANVNARWEFRHISNPAAFSSANAEIRIFDADGHLSSKHLVIMTSEKLESTDTNVPSSSAE